MKYKATKTFQIKIDEKLTQINIGDIIELNEDLANNYLDKLDKFNKQKEDNNGNKERI